MNEEKERGISINNAGSIPINQIKGEHSQLNIISVNVPFMKLSGSAVLPSYANDGDAGLDLTATSKQWNDTMKCWIYGMGIACAIPYGFVGLIFPRSSVRKYGIIMANCVGVIDAGYRGEISATFKELGNDKVYKVGERVAQLIIIPFPQVNIQEVMSLPESERGANGHGSTGE